MKVTKGNFVSRTNKYMFWKNGAAITDYASSTSKGNRTFAYMKDYNKVEISVISDCYYYKIGI